MIILIALLLALIPAAAVLYPFIRVMRGNAAEEWLDDEGSPMADLERRWESAISGVKSAELEFSIGNLEEGDYRWLRREYMREAAMVMRAMDLEEEQETELLAAIEQEIKQVRERASGRDDAVTDTQGSQDPVPGD